MIPSGMLQRERERENFMHWFIVQMAAVARPKPGASSRSQLWIHGPRHARVSQRWCRRWQLYLVHHSTGPESSFLILGETMNTFFFLLYYYEFVFVGLDLLDLKAKWPFDNGLPITATLYFLCLC